MADETKDPVDNRDEFIVRLNELFDPMTGIDQSECMEALIKDNLLYKTGKRTYIDSLKAKVTGYIQEYDNAQTREEREAVVGKVKR